MCLFLCVGQMRGRDSLNFENFTDKFGLRTIQMSRYVGRCVLLTLWQKLHTVSRPALTSEGTRRSSLNLAE